MEYGIGAVIGGLIFIAIVRGLVYRSQHPRSWLGDRQMERHRRSQEATEESTSQDAPKPQ